MFERTDGSQTEQFISGGTWATPYTDKNFIILEITDDMYKTLRSIYRENKAEKGVEAEKALVVFNGFELGENEEGEMEYLLNDLYKDGDEITFAWWTTEASKEEAEKDRSLLDYHEESFEIYSIYDASIYTRNVLSEYNEYTAVVFLPESVIKRSELTSSVSGAKINFDTFTRLKMYEGFDRNFLQPYLTRNPFMYVNYTDDEITRDTNLEIMTLSYVKDMLIRCEIVLVIFAIINIVYEKYKEFEKMFMTMRSLGYKPIHIICTLFIEYFVYYVVELFIIMLADIVMCLIYIPNLYTFSFRTSVAKKVSFYTAFGIANTREYAILLSGLVVVVVLIVTITTLCKKLSNFVRIKE